MKHRLKTGILFITALICITFAGCGFQNEARLKEKLLENVPDMDPSACSRFSFSMHIMTGNSDIGKAALSGNLEMQDNISHLKDMEASFEKAGMGIFKETWTDAVSGIRYLNNGDDWIIEPMDSGIERTSLADIINNRNGGITVMADDTAYALSWPFPADMEYLFTDILRCDTSSMNLKGTGRITAVFDPDTLKFSHFTIVASAINGENVEAVVDFVFHWDEKNRTGEDLKIPDEIVCGVYEASTGVITDGGYDERINPLAESFIASFGGRAEILHYDGGASLFWTKKEEGFSAAVNYERTADPDVRYEKNKSFLTSFYGDCVEENEGSAYFYNPLTGTLEMISRGEGWYGEIIITGSPDDTQGTLRRPLITYKSKLEL